MTTSMETCLARAVSRGLLPTGYALAALGAEIMREIREGTAAGIGTADERMQTSVGLFQIYLKRERQRRLAAENAIHRTLTELIAMRAPERRLMAEAHNANADYGAPLAEDEVTEAVRARIFRAVGGASKHARR